MTLDQQQWRQGDNINPVLPDTDADVPVAPGNPPVVAPAEPPPVVNTPRKLAEDTVNKRKRKPGKPPQFS